MNCSPERPFGVHPAVRIDENCPRCGWTAPGRRRDPLPVIEGWRPIEGDIAA